MVNKKLGCMILLILLVVPMILAITTTINVKTLANHDVQLKILDPYPGEGNKNLLEFLEGSSDETGLVSFESHASKSQINIAVIIMKDGNRIEINDKFLHEFKNRPTGSTIDLDVKDSSSEPIVPEINETEEVIEEPEEVVKEQTETVEEIKEDKGGGKIIGAIVDGGKTIVTSKITYYIIGGILVFGVLFFVIFIAKKKFKGRSGRYVNFKIQEDKGELKDKIEDKDKELKDAERKLEEVKAELDDIKNGKTKLQEAKERLERDKKELERLGG